MRKKILSLFLVIAFCLTLTGTRALADESLIMGIARGHGAPIFKDMDETNWAYTYVKYLKERGVVFGYPDGLYRPDDFVSKAEFASMATRALDLLQRPVETMYDYPDVPAGHWAYPYIQLASNYDLMKADENGYFHPDANVRRIEVISVITNALNVIEMTPNDAWNSLSIYEDRNEIPQWAILRTAKAKQLDMIIIPPGEQGYLSPMRPATRGEVAGFLVAMIERAKIAPNKKIAGKPKVIDGYILDNVVIEGETAYIPAGTILPLAVEKCFSCRVPKDGSATAQVGDRFVARATYNFVTKDKILVIPVGTTFEGVVQKVKRPTTLIKNAQMVLEIETIVKAKTADKVAEFPAAANVIPIRRKFTPNEWKMDNFLAKCGYNIMKGQNVWIHMGQLKEFVLLRPVEVDITTNWPVQ